MLESTGAAGDLRTFLEHDVQFHRLPEVARAAMTAICAEVVAEMGRL